jgi:pimeloyl-ACP methyl ester carboxylesterase
MLNRAKISGRQVLLVGLITGLLMALTGGATSEAQSTGEIWHDWRLLTGTTNVPLTAASYSRSLDEDLYLFAKGAEDNRIYVRVRGRTGFGQWAEIPGGGSTDAAMAAVEFGGQLHLFAKSIANEFTPGRTWVKTLTGTAWSDWTAIPGLEGASGFAVTVFGNPEFGGKLYLFAKGRNGRIYFNTRSISTSWVGWNEVPGGGTTDAGIAAVTFREASREKLRIFVKGIGDRQIYYNTFDGTSWSGWGAVPGGGTTDASIAATVYRGRIYIFVKGIGDKKVYVNVYVGGTFGWSGWYPVPGDIQVDVALATTVGKSVGDQPLELYLFAKDTQGQILYTAHSFYTPNDDVPEVNTRGHFSGGTLVLGRTPYEYRTTGVIPGVNGSCSPEIAIIVHGWDNDAKSAQVRFKTARHSLRSLVSPPFSHPIVGFSWDSDTRYWTIGGWGTGKDHADGNGRKLAQFLDDLKAACPAIKIHLMGHSLGARVVLQAIKELNENSRFRWKRDGRKIDDVHTLGAAVDNETPHDEVSTELRYGPAIRQQVGRFFNYCSDEDDILEFIYTVREADNALGETCIEDPSRKPSNYTDVSVLAEVQDDHFIYWGSPAHEVPRYPGAMQKVRERM